jgi:hypothetical protein
VLDAVASAGAAERLGGDPLWLLVISGSGAAKTETVQSLRGAGALITSTIASEGALLAATTPRGGPATGGLLPKLGRRGILVIKDFTTILAMDGKVRATVLAALREVHDGYWQRNVGVSGGRTLTWTGRIVVIAACTTAWDEARKAIEAMGDRFVLVRADSTTGREESALMAIGNTGREDIMRIELAKAMGDLVASVWATAQWREFGLAAFEHMLVSSPCLCLPDGDLVETTLLRFRSRTTTHFGPSS